jgi:ribosomal protein S18 acetylase RimI-like enzyme
VIVEEATEVTAELVEAFARLIPQLTTSNPPPGEAELREIVASPVTSVLVARLEPGGPIVGTLTLSIFRIPTAVRAWIEDVVADAGATGHGIGRALTEEAIRLAGVYGAKTVELTSRPSREAANHIYQSLGFQIRETNVYRFELA